MIMQVKHKNETAFTEAVAPCSIEEFKEDYREHCAGRKWHTELHQTYPDMVPHELPDLDTLDELLHDLPLAVRSFANEPEFYNAVVAIPPGYSFGGAPIRLKVCS